MGQALLDKERRLSSDGIILVNFLLQVAWLMPYFFLYKKMLRKKLSK